MYLSPSFETPPITKSASKKQAALKGVGKSANFERDASDERELKM